MTAPTTEPTEQPEFDPHKVATDPDFRAAAEAAVQRGEQARQALFEARTWSPASPPRPSATAEQPATEPAERRPSRDRLPSSAPTNRSPSGSARAAASRSTT